MEKRGQIVVDFLIAYGWAVLGIVIAISLIAYFGVFSSGKYITGSAVLNPPFYVDAWSVSQGSEVSSIFLEVRNNGREDYDILEILIEGCGDYDSGIMIGKNEVSRISVECDSMLEDVGETFRGAISVVYKKEGSMDEMVSKGLIAEKIGL